jgi:hypothetical protein
MPKKLSVPRSTLYRMVSDEEATRQASALLWDVDNVCPRLTTIYDLGRALSGLVAPGSPRIASAHRQRFRVVREPLEALGMDVISGGVRPQGADLMLLNKAKWLRRAGVRRFVVASNDHEFARLAKWGAVHVATLTETLVSGELRAAAQTVTVINIESDG